MSSSALNSSSSSSSSSGSALILPGDAPSTDDIWNAHIITPQVKVLFWTLLVLIGLVIMSLLVVFYRRRHIQPIKARVPTLVCATVCVVWCWMSYVGFHMIFVTSFPCWLDLICSHLLVSVTFDLYFLRIWVLFFAYNLTREKLGSGGSMSIRSMTSSSAHSKLGALSHDHSEISHGGGGGGDMPMKQLSLSPQSKTREMSINTSDTWTWTSHAQQRQLHNTQLDRTHKNTSTSTRTNTSQSTQTWYMNNKHLVSRPYLLLLFVCVCLIQSIPPIALISSTPSDQTDVATQCLSRPVADNFLAASLGVYIVLLVYSAYRVRIVEDAFYIKQEFKTTAYFVSIMAVGWFVLGWIPSVAESNMTSPNSIHFPVSSLFLLLMGGMFLTYVMLLPIYYSYSTTITTQQMQEKYSIENINSLEKLLNHRVGADVFKAFMVKEFAVENFLFYVATREFEAKYQAQDFQIAEQATQLQLLQLLQQRQAQIPAPSPQSIHRQLTATSTPALSACSTPPCAHRSIESTLLRPMSSRDSMCSILAPPAPPRSTGSQFDGVCPPSPSRSPLSELDPLTLKHVPRSSSVPSCELTSPPAPAHEPQQQQPQQGRTAAAPPPLGSMSHNQNTTKQFTLTKHDKRARYMHAKQIYDRFICPASAMQVNLPAHTVYQLSQALELQAPSSPSMSPIAQSHTIMNNSNAFNNGCVVSMAPLELPAPELNPATHPTAVTAHGQALSDEGTTSTANKAQTRAHVPATLFTTAQRDIYKLMLNDSYKRFLLSPEHAELKLELGGQEEQLNTEILPDINIV